jgi:hypothetical protein
MTSGPMPAGSPIVMPRIGLLSLNRFSDLFGLGFTGLLL